MKRLCLSLIILAVAWSASANPVDRQQARQHAEKFMQVKGAIIGEEASARSFRHKAPTTNQPFYVFNTVGDRGFVIVAGDDRIDPILGYTTQGRFEENDLPVNFKAWLEQTASEIESFTKTQKTQTTSGPKASVKPVAIHNEVNPLILTTWNQGNYDNDLNTDGVYNIHLPKIGGQYPCTGCVATAGAQVMYYYKWPEDLTQTVPGYVINGSMANTKEDLPPIQFQWNKMKTNYIFNDPDADAVADLMLYCGYATQMKYGIDGSSGSTDILADGMCKYFDYNPNTWKTVYRYQYSISEWDELIYNELANGRPVIYSGSFNSAHAFICDGYDGAGMYHFNWGWGGGNNGYFKLQATNPDGVSDVSSMGYIDENYCVIGLQPNSWPDINDPNADDTWETTEIQGIVATASNVTVEDLNVKMTFSNKNEASYAFGYGIGELNSNGSITPIDKSNEKYKGWGELGNGWYFSDVPFDFSSYQLSDGTHTLVPICIVNGETEWRRCKPADLYFEVNVSGGGKTIIAHPIEDIKINDFDLASGGTPGCWQGINLNITNNGDNLEKDLYFYVGTADDLGKYAAKKTIRIASGNTKEYRLNTSALDAGNYTLRLLNKYNGDVVLAQKDITISLDLQATNFEITGSKYANKILQVDVTVENHAGDYAVPLYLFASNTNSKKFVYAAGSAIERGSSEVVTFYFQPKQAGTWNLWVATDQKGENVIGESSVEVSEQNPANLSIKSQAQNLSGNTIKAENLVVTVDVTNIGEYAYDDVIEARLFKLEPGTNTGYQVDVKKKELQLEPGAKTSFDFTFDNLEDGSSYFFYIYFYSTEGSKIILYRASGGYSYVFEYTPNTGDTTPGDANGDGKMDASDITSSINYIAGKSVAGFNFDAADMNKDGVVNIADIIIMMNAFFAK